jgi:hypothetical protein
MGINPSYRLDSSKVSSRVSISTFGPWMGFGNLVKAATYSAYRSSFVCPPVNISNIIINSASQTMPLARSYRLACMMSTFYAPQSERWYRPARPSFRGDTFWLPHNSDSEPGQYWLPLLIASHVASKCACWYCRSLLVQPNSLSSAVSYLPLLPGQVTTS